MAAPDNFDSFLKENKKLAKEYIDIRVEIGRLRLVRMISLSAGHLVWVIVSLFLFSLLCTFIGLVAGFWFSELTGSYVKGFALATLCILVFIILVALLRRVLFVNPIIRAIIRKSGKNHAEKEVNLN